MNIYKEFCEDLCVLRERSTEHFFKSSTSCGKRINCWRLQMTACQYVWVNCKSAGVLDSNQGRVSRDHHKDNENTSSYLCSTLTAIKTKLGSTLDIRNTLRVALSPIRWDRLTTEKQVEGSHWFCIIVEWHFYALWACYYYHYIILFYFCTVPPFPACETMSHMTSVGWRRCFRHLVAHCFI